jgi:hypothetical protein
MQADSLANTDKKPSITPVNSLKCEVGAQVIAQEYSPKTYLRKRASKSARFRERVKGDISFKRGFDIIRLIYHDWNYSLNNEYE